jgi:AcrR family transcriptional regulator
LNETQKKLINTATEAIAELGFDKANVNQIAQAAGFSIGTLYNYFPTKRDLMLTIIDEISQTHITFIVDKVSQTEDPIKRLKVFFEAGFDFVESNRIQSKAIFNTLNGPDQEFKVQLFSAYQPLFELLEKDIIGVGLAQLLFHNVDPARTANLLMLTYLGVGSQSSEEGKLWMNATEVSQFVLNSLRYEDEEE